MRIYTSLFATYAQASGLTGIRLRLLAALWAEGLALFFAVGIRKSPRPMDEDHEVTYHGSLLV